MKRKIVTVIVTAMMITSMTACGQTADSASAKESVPDTGESVVIDTETEELETEEPTELAEATEEIEATEVEETENTEEEQVASTDKETQDTSENSTSSNTANNNAGTTASTANNNVASTAGTTSETPAVSTPTVSDTTTAATPDTTTSEHEHVWVEHLATGHYEEQVVTAAYDEPTYEYQDVCNKCGTVLVDEEAIAIHYGFYCDGSYSNVKVQTGTVHHDAVTQTVWVEDAAGWYECSICGERDIRASHNHN